MEKKTTVGGGKEITFEGRKTLGQKGKMGRKRKADLLY